MGFLTNKKALIVGLANDHSIAYGIAKAMHEQGATLAFTYVNDKLKTRVEKIAGEFETPITLPCDVSSDEQINQLFVDLKKHWDHLDIIVHAVAFAPREQLEGDYLEHVTREGFNIAHDISSYSFAALAKAGFSMMENRPGALVSISYQGSQRVVPNYNVMGVAKASLEANVRYMANSLGPKGIRVNAISAGPIRTLSAAGIKNFRKMLSYDAKVNLLRRNVTIEEVGNTAAFLCSDLASGITGEIIHVDSGFHCVGIGNFDSEKEDS